MNKGDENETPRDLYDMLNKRFRFTLDPCTTAKNPLNTPRIYTKASNGLRGEWRPGPVFMNPPYSETYQWCARAWSLAKHEGVLTVGLLRLDPTTKWWKTFIAGEAVWVWPIPKRLRFVGHDASYPFPNAIVVWHGLSY